METKDEFRSRMLDLMDQADRAIKEGNELLIRQGKVLVKAKPYRASLKEV